MFKGALGAGDYFLLVQQLEGQVHECQAFPKAALLECLRGFLGTRHGLAWGAHPWPWSASTNAGTALNICFPLELVSPRGESMGSRLRAST